MPSIIKTAKGYRAQVFVKGVRDSRSFRTKREADAWASARETEIRTQINSAPARRFTLSDAMRKYGEEVCPTKRGERHEQLRLAAWEKDPAFPAEMKIGEIEPEHLAKWRDARLKIVAASSVLRDFKLLASVFEAARREWRWIESNPVRDVRKPRAPDHRNVVIGRPQIKRMLRALDYSPQAGCSRVSHAVAHAFLLALRTGMRAKEICDLTWDRVKPDYCILLETKTVPRNVPLVPKAMRIIEKMRGFDDDLVFGLSTTRLDAMFRKYRDKAGLDGFTFHDARHTAATWMSSKIDVLTLCKVFGWKNTAQALVYYNPTASDITKMLVQPKPGQSR